MPWKLDPFAAVLLAVTLSAYVTGTARVWRHAGLGRGVLAWQVFAFVLGCTMLALTVLSPIATWSEALFSVHMTQHELLVLVAAPLLSMGRPMTAFAWAVRSPRAQPWVSSLNGALRTASLPAVACALHAFALWIWHVPALYEVAIRHDWVHALEHASFLVTACLLWAGLLQGSYGRLGYGVAFAYVFVTALHSGLLGALFALAPSPVYQLYVERARGGAVDPLADQQLAGVLMWVPAGIVMTVFGLAFFAAWLGELERRNDRGLGRFTLERPR